MRQTLRLLLIVLLIFGMGSPVQAACTYTTNLALCKPAEGDTDWDTSLNANFDILDAPVKMFLTGGWNATGVAKAGTLKISAAPVNGTANYGFYVATTLLNAAVDQYGNYIEVTGAGNAAGAQYALRAELNAGYTGSEATFAIRGVNNSDSIGGSLTLANRGLDGVSHGTGTASTSLVNIGVQGHARWATNLNVGVHGLGTYTNGAQERLAQNSVGVLGQGVADATGKEIGGIFFTGNTEPTYTVSAALIADNVGTTDPIFLARDNGTVAFAVYDGGKVAIGTAVLTGVNQYDLVFPNNRGPRGVINAGTSALALILLDATDAVVVGATSGYALKLTGDNIGSAQAVTTGANDTGGAGYRLLRVPNS